MGVWGFSNVPCFWHPPTFFPGGRRGGTPAKNRFSPRTTGLSGLWDILCSIFPRGECFCFDWVLANYYVFEEHPGSVAVLIEYSGVLANFLKNTKYFVVHTCIWEARVVILKYIIYSLLQLLTTKLIKPEQFFIYRFIRSIFIPLSRSLSLVFMMVVAFSVVFCC